MAWTREQTDARDLALGFSLATIESTHNYADRYKQYYAARDPAPECPLVLSDSGSDDGALPSPPVSSKGDGPDLSERAWRSRKWADIARGIDPRESGFDHIQFWRSTMRAQHTVKGLTTSSLSKKSAEPEKQRGPAVQVTKR